MYVHLTLKAESQSSRSVGSGCGYLYKICGVGVGVGVARSRGNEPGVGVGVGADQAALTPTPERLLKFAASLAHPVMRICCLSGNKFWKYFAFFSTTTVSLYILGVGTIVGSFDLTW